MTAIGGLPLPLYCNCEFVTTIVNGNEIFRFAIGILICFWNIRIFVDMHDFHLTRSELTCLRFGGWISNSDRGLYFYEMWLCFAYVNSLICTFYMWLMQFMTMIVRTMIADQNEQ